MLSILLLIAFSVFCEHHSTNKPFLFLTQNLEGEIEIDKSSFKRLERLAGEKEIRVVSIVGPYRTGKSFLLNLLCGSGPQNYKSIFKVDSTVQPCTLGVWAHTVTKSGKLFIFLDSTGLFSPATSEKSDARLMAILSLISSKLLYNHIGVIDSTEVSKFSFIVRYSRAITGMLFADSSSEGSEFRPDLCWVARDFFLDLKDEKGAKITTLDWLLSVLKKVQFGTEILKLFQNVSAFTLPFPVSDTSLLRNVTPAIIDDQFLIFFESLRLNIFRETRPKSINGSPITTRKLFRLLEVFSDTLNKEESFSSLTTVNSLMSLVNDKLAEKILSEAESSLEKISLPIPVSLLNTEFIKIHKKASDQSERDGFDSDFTEKLSIKLSTLLRSFEQKNDLAMIDYFSSLVQVTGEKYKKALQEIKLPQKPQLLFSTISSVQQRFLKSFSTSLQKFGRVRDIEEYLRNVTDLLKRLESQLFELNEAKIEKSCYSISEHYLKTLFSAEKIASYWSYSQFDLDVALFRRGLTDCLSDIHRSKIILDFEQSQVHKNVILRIQKLKFWYKKSIFGATFLFFVFFFIGSRLVKMISCLLFGVVVAIFSQFDLIISESESKLRLVLIIVEELSLSLFFVINSLLKCTILLCKSIFKFLEIFFEGVYRYLF